MSSFLLNINWYSSHFALLYIVVLALKCVLSTSKRCMMSKYVRFHFYSSSSFTRIHKYFCHLLPSFKPTKIFDQFPNYLRCCNDDVRAIQLFMKCNLCNIIYIWFSTRNEFQCAMSLPLTTQSTIFNIKHIFV